MCGINGIFAYHYAANPIDRKELTKTRDHMSARGPDGKGEWVSDDQHVGFGHRRLSIIDLSDAGAQPMPNQDGSLIVTFNGEIYNYRKLRSDLETKGYKFRSNSDTEVLLHLYAEKGEAMVHDLRGMFAFAIWDAKHREIFLARDPYGIKPLYYSDDGWTFRFASSVKALLAGGQISRDLEPAGWVGFQLWGCVPEPWTTYQSIRQLPAGCTLFVDKIGAGEPRRYYDIASIYAMAEGKRPMPAEELTEHVRVALTDSARHHMIADVSVGAFLSAGIDSGSLVGLMRETSTTQLQTVTLRFEEFQDANDDEAPLAAEVAAHYGVEHHVRTVTKAEFAADFPKLMEAMDQPSIDGVNSWFVAKAAVERGLKVAVSGLGGDELFGGYPSFKNVPRWQQWLALPSRLPAAGWISRRVLQPFIRQQGWHPKLAGLIAYGGSHAGAYLLQRALYMPFELANIMDPELAVLGLRRLRPIERADELIRHAPKSPKVRVACLESGLYMRNQLLRDTDWASMAHSLEVRVPLVDTSLLQSLAGQSAGVMQTGKALLARAPDKPLPQIVSTRAKTGFVTPVHRWMANLDAPVSASASPRQTWARHWSGIVAHRARDARLPVVEGARQ